MKYINEALIGNGKILGSVDDKNRLVRLYYPSIDYRQLIDEFIIGIRINESQNTLWLHDEMFEREQTYIENTNIVNCRYIHKESGIYLNQALFIDLTSNNLMMKFETTNLPEGIYNIDIVCYSKLDTTNNNKVSDYIDVNRIVQYSHDMFMAIETNKILKGYSINNSSDKISWGQIVDEEDTGMSNDTAILVNLYNTDNTSKDNSSIYIMLRLGTDRKEIDNVKIKVENFDKVYKENIKQYKLKIEELNSRIGNKINNKIIVRTYLLYMLLINKETGAMMAACEVDEDFTRCGRYGYTWIRDMIFCLKGLLELGFENMIDKYFNIFIPNVQFEDGSFAQRYYTDGAIAPSWGIQNDEIAMAVIGYKQYYNYLKRKNKVKAKKLITDNKKVIEKAIGYLINNYTKKTYTLWEMDKKLDIYAVSVVKKALLDYEYFKEEMPNLFKENLDVQKPLNEVEKLLKKMLKEDELSDISDLMLYTFLDIEYPMKDIRRIATRIEEKLFIPGVGYKRFEGDTYMGGNVWNLSNLIMTRYYIKQNNLKKAKEILKYTEENTTNNNFIPEQIVDKEARYYWVYGLTWAHSWYTEIILNDIENA